MLFNSFEFLIFFPIVTLLYFLLPHGARNPLLLIASCVFYMAFVPLYILILLFTIVVDYYAGIAIERSSGVRRKHFLILSLVANIGILAVFKYYNFLNENLSFFLGTFHVQNPIPFLSILLPIGLSFHTFQAMSYTIEVYRGNQRAERNFLIYALYVMFYPQLVAGPIERPQNLLYQFHEPHSFDHARVVAGLRLMLWGMVKKVVIADRLAVAVTTVFSNPESHFGLAALLAVYFFTFQIYLDFSAYSDIARGCAEVMGFKLMRNFNAPYLAKSLSEFWLRWHISLSTWFKDYLYFPLGGNRVSFARWQINLIIVFLVSGLWHGASWNFIIWGGLHGFALVFLNVTQPVRSKIARFLKLEMFPRATALLGGLVTFHFVAFAWIFFRAATFNDVVILVRNLFEWKNGFAVHQFSSFGIGLFDILLGIVLTGSIVALERLSLRQKPFSIDFFPSWVRWGTYYAAVGLILFLGVFSKHQFIYFQF